MRETRHSKLSSTELVAIARSERRLGEAAMGLVAETDANVPSTEDFVRLVRGAVRSIDKWAHGDTSAVPPEVEQLRNASAAELAALHETYQFTILDLSEWTGEMQSRVTAVRSR